jgi:hypothetical protein
LSEESTIQGLEDQAKVIKNEVTRVLRQKAKQVRICARSKKWWNTRIAENRKILGFMKRERRGGRTNHAFVKEARKELRKEIRESKRE